MQVHFFLIIAIVSTTLISFIPVSFAMDYSITTDDLTKKEYLTRPTFGLDHENNQKLVEDGFKLNNQTFSINNNFHTPFAEQTIPLGEATLFEAKVFSEKGLRVQEFLFGVPKVGDAHLAEVGVEVWINSEGKIENVKIIQESNVIDENTIVSTHDKVNCKHFSSEKNCDSTKISVVFLEPLKDKVMAIKAIDSENRFQITYLNDGIDVSGNSLNPMQSTIIPSPVKNEGLIELTQSKKYSILWVTTDGRVFERNTFGSFKQINNPFERFEDSGDPTTRYHSGFGNLIKNEQTRAVGIFNSTSLISELPESFTYDLPEPKKRITEEIKQNMVDQEKRAKKIIEGFYVQARFSNTEY